MMPTTRQISTLLSRHLGVDCAPYAARLVRAGILPRRGEPITLPADVVVIEGFRKRLTGKRSKFYSETPDQVGEFKGKPGSQREVGDLIPGDTGPKGRAYKPSVPSPPLDGLPLTPESDVGLGSPEGKRAATSDAPQGATPRNRPNPIRGREAIVPSKPPTSKRGPRGTVSIEDMNARLCA